jgi:hypothetical protein
MTQLSKIVRESQEMCSIVQRHIEQGSFTSIETYLRSLTRVEIEVLAGTLLVLVYDLTRVKS